MQSSIIISGQILGGTKPLFADWRIPLPPDIASNGNRLTLRELLNRIVLEEVEAFRTRTEERRLTRILTKTEIARGVERGKVDMGGRNLEQNADPQAAVENALQAFEDGLYFVFIDDEQQQELDSEVYLKPNSQVMFLRLVPLVGG